LKKPNKYFLFLLATVVAYALFEYYRPKPLDWTATYQNDDKIPFGTRALFELLPDVMGKTTVTSLRLPTYNHLTESKLPTRSNYVFVCSELDLDENDRRELLRYVRRGNNVFISAYDLPDSLMMALDLRADLKAPTLRDTTLLQNFTNPSLKKPDGYNFKQDDGRNFLLIRKAKNITVLARNARQEPTFVRVGYGQGQFLIHNLPLALTNYYVLDPATSDHAFKALSYLPALPTYWDEYQKQGRFDEDQQSIFRYIWSQPPLKWAYYLAIWGLIFYMIFAGKRTQRIIPVQVAPRNSSLEFVQTVGRMYFQQGDHNNLGQKRIRYFMAHLRDRYGLETNNLDNEFTEVLSRKSGVIITDVQALVRQLQMAQRSISLSEPELLALNAAIETFTRQTR
jgi:hypothetical protein